MSYSIAEFEHIYTGNVVLAMRLAVSLLGNEDDASDVVQDVFLKLWKSDVDINNPQAFVIRSVLNACLDRLKSLSVHERVRQGLRIEPMTSDDDVGERQTEVGWSNAILNVRATFNDFAKWNYKSDRTEMLSPHYDAFRQNYSQADHCCVKLTTSYTLSFGKKVERGGDSIRHGSVNSGILK